MVSIWASCLGTSVDLDVVKTRKYDSTICRDLGIVFSSSCRPRRREKKGARIDDVSRFGHPVWRLCRPRRREKEGASIDDLSRFGHRVWRLCRPTRFCNRRIFNEFPMKINDFAAFFVPSTYVERWKRGFCMKRSHLEWKTNDFCGDHLHTSIRENMIFCSKNNEFFNEFSMKMNDFATFCGSSIHREQQKRWFWIKKMWNLNKNAMIFCKFLHDHLYTEMCENIDFSLKKQWFLCKKWWIFNEK